MLDVRGGFLELLIALRQDMLTRTRETRDKSREGEVRRKETPIGFTPEQATLSVLACAARPQSPRLRTSLGQSSQRLTT